MNSIGLIRSCFSNLLRLVHVSLWMTLPATFLLWLGQAPPPPPRACEPYCGWYQGNVLDVSEDTFLTLWFILALAGFCSWLVWTGGYCFEIARRVMAGKSALPPVERRWFRVGRRLIWSSLLYWLPSLAILIVGLVFLGTLHWRTVDRLDEPLLLLSALVALVMLWGNAVGIARFAAAGQRAVMLRRRENMRLALTNLPATLALSALVFVVVNLGSAGLAWLSLQGYFLHDADLTLQAAAASFALFMVVQAGCCIVAWLMGRYGIWLDLRDRFKADREIS